MITLKIRSSFKNSNFPIDEKLRFMLYELMIKLRHLVTKQTFSFFCHAITKYVNYDLMLREVA